MGDYHVDRRSVEAPQGVEPRRTNQSTELSKGIVGVAFTLSELRKQRIEGYCFLFAKSLFSASWRINERNVLSIPCWWFGDGETPVLIPNTAVKFS